MNDRVLRSSNKRLWGRRRPKSWWDLVGLDDMKPGSLINVVGDQRFLDCSFIKDRVVMLFQPDGE
jgi:hypothetical protein